MKGCAAEARKKVKTFLESPPNLEQDSNKLFELTCISRLKIKRKSIINLVDRNSNIIKIIKHKEKKRF